MTRHCEHVKANGHFCGSPAMRGRNYCFFHIIDIGRRLRLSAISTTACRLRRSSCRCWKMPRPSNSRWCR